uniref:Protease 3 n=1 Tax=Candidatus Kentrum sp. SD TaxID=2126332 RepID=A0A451BMB2_9GAMM|nr:MAG: Secreted Zn-dependent peptidases, insulinase-like [Candidatus Kentron sp. SD]
MRIIFLFILLNLAPVAWCDISTVTSSPHDARQYAVFELPNRLKVLVISDPETDKAACALDVFAGSGADPEDRPGLAHFLEHMLFLGTRKYPEPDAFETFITKHAGEQNAYTDFAHTNYFFEVDSGHLREGLDRFGQFFIAPVFAETYVNRERSAVDAEFHSKKKDDAWRKMETIKQVMNPRHPLSRFSVGNLATLSEKTDTGDVPLREALIAFYRRYYSANLMTLAVLGKEPPDVLMQWVKDIFSAVPDFEAKPPKITGPMFAPGALPVRVTLEPVRELRELKLLFPVPPIRPHYKTKPLYYISHILGHEGKGSLLSFLKERGWAEALSAGALHDHPDSATFAVSIALTEKGLREVQGITTLVFETIRLIETLGIREWLFQEISQLAKLDFLFQEKSPPMDTVSRLANALREYPVIDVLRGPFAMDHYDEDLIRRYLGALTPDNMLLMVLDPNVARNTIPRETIAGTKIDAPGPKALQADAPWREVPWFGARYKRTPIAPHLLHGWREASGASPITIPAPNIFIPGDLSPASGLNPEWPFPVGHFGYEPGDNPTRIVHAPGVSAWFRPDTNYGAPQANFYFSIRSPVANDTPRHSVMTSLLAALTRDQLTEFSYPASLAGLDYQLYPHMRGLSVRISGYHDKQKVLLDRIVETLRQPELEPERFRIAKQELLRKLRNMRKRKPYRQAILEIRDLLLRPHWTPEARIEALGSVTLSDLRAFLPKLFGRLSLAALSHGNLHRENALHMIDPLRKRLIPNALPTRVPRRKITRLPKGLPRLLRIALDHGDSVVAVYFQGPRRGFRELAVMELLAQILKTPFFHQLRTKQELGYIVSASAFPLLEVPGLLFLVQSPDTPPRDLENRIQRFLVNGTNTLANMREAEFARHKTALAARIMTLEESLGVRSDRYWEEIDREIDTFDSRERKADALRAITLPEIREIHQTKIIGKNKRQLIIHAVGHRHKLPSIDEARDTEVVIIEDPARFKREQDVFPEFDSFVKPSGK